MTVRREGPPNYDHLGYRPRHQYGSHEAAAALSSRSSRLYLMAGAPRGDRLRCSHEDTEARDTWMLAATSLCESPALRRIPCAKPSRSAARNQARSYRSSSMEPKLRQL